MLIYIVFAAVLLLFCRYLWRRREYDLQKIPSPPSSPFFGHLFDMIFNRGQKQLALYVGEKFKLLGYPKLMRMDFLGINVLFLTDIDSITNIVMSRTDPLPRYFTNNTLGQLLVSSSKDTKALVQLPGTCPYVKAIRRIHATAMQSASLKKVTPDILHHIDVAMDIIEESRMDGPVELSELLLRLTLDIIGTLAFETNMGGLDGSRDIHGQFQKVEEIAMEAIRNPLLGVYWKLFPWAKQARELKNHSQALRDEYTNLVNFFQQRDDPPDGEEPLWYGLKTMKDPETGEPISAQSMLAEVGYIVFSGTEATAQQLGWILMLLAAYPQVTDKLLVEFKQHRLYGQKAREVAFDDLGDLEYLTAVIKEGMRICYTSAGPVARNVPNDMDLLEYHIPKGTLIHIPGTCAYSTQEDWGDPDVFRPERWLTGEDMSNKYYLGFSVGPRDCLGQKLAMLEMRLAIVKLVTRFEFKLEGEWRSIFDNAIDGIVVKSRNGMWFHITPRTVDE